MRPFKHLLLPIGLFGVLFGVLMSGLGMAAGAAPIRPVPEQLHAAVADNGRVRVIVGVDVPSFQLEPQIRSRSAVVQQRQQIAAAQENLLSELTAYQPEEITLYKTIPYLAVEIDAAGLDSLVNNPHVTYVQEDMLFFPSLGSSTEVIGAPAVWNEGYDGEGQTVVVIDTGVDAAHPFFEGRVVDEACFSNPASAELDVPTTTLCPSGTITQTGPGSSDPTTAACVASGTNLCFHGTHVAGIAAGHNDDFQGVAPGADIIGMQVFFRIDDFDTCFLMTFSSACVSATFADILQALEYVYTDLVPVYEIAAVNMSLGGDQYFDSETCDAELAALKTVIDQLLAVEVATVIASGNSGWTNSVNAPGCISSAVTVGATDDNDAVTSFSNMDEMVDLLAPGASIESAVPDGGYNTFDGTSMAAPHVAGAWAVMREVYPAKGVAEMLEILEGTGQPVTDNRAGGSVTRPRIDLTPIFGPSVLLLPDEVDVTLATQTSYTTAITLKNVGMETLTWAVSDVVALDENLGALAVQNRFSMTHSLSQEILPDHSVTCETGEQRWFRVFDLAEFGMIEPFKVTAVEVGVQESISLLGIGQAATVNLYTLEGEFGDGDMVLVQAAEVAIPDVTQQIVRLPIEGSVPAGSTLVVEIVYPEPFLSGGTIFGSNQAGQTAPTYWQAANCGVSVPTDVASLGYPEMQLVLNVWGEVDVPLGPCNRPLLEGWAQMGVTSGTILSGEQSTVPLMIEGSGLSAGTHRERLCLTTNDSNRPLLEVPLWVTVSNCAGQPTCIESPQAAFSLSAAEGIAPLTVAFTNLSAGEIEGLVWDFGDGAQSTAEAPQHTFETAGLYDVTLQVSNTAGVDTATERVTVFAPAEAAFTATVTAGEGVVTTTFHNLSTGHFDQCLWDLGDGETVQSCVAVTHTYDEVGRYDVTLAISGDGGVDFLEKEAYIEVYEVIVDPFFEVYLPLVRR